jgi:hypothetical protein
MLSFAPDFWPLFWTILGGAALVSVVLSLLAAAFSPAWFRPHHRHQPASTPAGPAGRQAGHPHRGRREVKAA